MATIRELNKWANAHTYYPLDLVRVIFGVFLFLKGVSFITETKYLHDILNTAGNFGSEMLIIHYVSMAHIVGGTMICIGFLTRWSVWVQMPILICALLLNFFSEFNTSNFIQATAALLLAIFFIFYGSGKHSIDYYLKMEK